MNHFGRCCVKLKCANIENTHERANNIKRNSISSASSSSYSNKSNINPCTKPQGSRAMTSVILNGVRAQMLYDPGESYSIISKVLWK